MRQSKFGLVLAAVVLSASTSAFAQHGPSREDRPAARSQPAPHHTPPAGRVYVPAAPAKPVVHGSHARFDGHRQVRGAGPRQDLHAGQRLPRHYRARQYVVHDWRGHRLAPPARGQQWVKTGSDYVLVAIASGVIASIVLGR